jgi:4-hydroxy-tetrahydrodipicolinate synthase
MRVRGFHVVAQTPFSEDGALDVPGIGRLCDFYIGHHVEGFTVLGISGEAFRLTLDEAVTTAREYVRHAGGRPVYAGVSNASSAHLVDLTRRVMDEGATGVMIAPPAGLKTEEEVARYFAEVIAAIGEVPVVLQDFPAASGVHMSVPTIVRLVEAHPTICAIKHEDFPGLPKLSRLDRELTRRVGILTGSNAQYLPEELRRGADGPMAGISFPEVLAGIWRHHEAGDEDAADALFETFLPLIRHEAQGLWGLACRKEILRRRGALASGFMRAPAPRLTATDMAEIDRLLRRLSRRSDAVAAALVA